MINRTLIEHEEPAPLGVSLGTGEFERPYSPALRAPISPTAGGAPVHSFYTRTALISPRPGAPPTIACAACDAPVEDWEPALGKPLCLRCWDARAELESKGDGRAFGAWLDNRVRVTARAKRDGEMLEAYRRGATIDGLGERHGLKRRGVFHALRKARIAERRTKDSSEHFRVNFTAPVG